MVGDGRWERREVKETVGLVVVVFRVSQVFWWKAGGTPGE